MAIARGGAHLQHRLDIRQIVLREQRHPARARLADECGEVSTSSLYHITIVITKGKIIDSKSTRGPAAERLAPRHPHRTAVAKDGAHPADERARGGDRSEQEVTARWQPEREQPPQPRHVADAVPARPSARRRPAPPHRPGVGRRGTWARVTIDRL
jgi:hypothetical protein